MTSNLNVRLKNFEKRQIITSLLVLLIFLCLSIVFNFVQLNGQAIQTSKFISRMIQIEDFREVGITLQEAKLNHFTMIKYVSADARRSFTLPEVADLIPDHSFWKVFSHDQVVVSTSSGDKMIFEFSRFNDIKWAILFWILLNLVSIPQTRFMKRKIIDGFDESIKIERELARADIAQKLRHNIRTPLSALIRLSAREAEHGADNTLLSSVIVHIKNLISELDDPKQVIKPASSSVYPVLTDALREVRIVSPARLIVTTDVEDSLISAACQIVGHELRSIIANLAMNAFEATPDGGRVDILVKDFGDRLLIEVKDTGKGIPQEILSRLTEKGFSFEKPSGTGLGLSHAKEHLEAWGGGLVIKSEVGVGTMVQATVPIFSRESWYVPRIKIRSHHIVVIIDDQPTIHEMWKERLFGARLSKAPEYFLNISTAKDFISKSAPGNLMIFADYDLGEKLTGLDFLKSLDFVKEKYLVTGHFDDQNIQHECTNQKISLIPKTTLSDIPIAYV